MMVEPTMSTNAHKCAAAKSWNDGKLYKYNGQTLLLPACADRTMLQWAL